MRIALSLITLFISINVQAIPVKWEISDTERVAGIDTTYGFPEIDFSLWGSFIYDADTNAYSEVELFFNSSVIAADLSPSCTYGNTPNYACPTDSAVTFASYGDYDPETGAFPQSYYRLMFDAPLTNAGGSTSILQSSQFIKCDPYEGCEGGISSRNGYMFLPRGVISGTVVPLPAAVWLFGSAIAGLGFMRRKVNPNKNPTLHRAKH